MKGLLIKDLFAILQRKKFLVLLLIMSIFLSFSMDGSFIIGYISMIGILMSLSALSYDEYDNSLSFIMTLPITRKQFAVEKFLFCFLNGIVFWLISILFYIVSAKISGTTIVVTELIKDAAAFLPFILLIPALTIPLQLKYGIEKQRIILYIFGGIMLAAVPLIQNLETDRFNAITTFLVNNSFILCVCGCLLGIAIITVSVFASIKIMENKEF